MPPVRRTLPERIAYHRAELERLTGKMVSLRDRSKYLASQRTLQKKKRVKLSTELEGLRAFKAALEGADLP